MCKIDNGYELDIGGFVWASDEIDTRPMKSNVFLGCETLIIIITTKLTITTIRSKTIRSSETRH